MGIPTAFLVVAVTAALAPGTSQREPIAVGRLLISAAVVVLGLGLYSQLTRPVGIGQPSLIAAICSRWTSWTKRWPISPSRTDGVTQKFPTT